MNSIANYKQEFTFVCDEGKLPNVVCFQAAIYLSKGVFTSGIWRKSDINYVYKAEYGAVPSGGEPGAAAQLRAIFDFLWDRGFQIVKMICHEPHTFLTEAQCQELLAGFLKKKRASR